MMPVRRLIIIVFRHALGNTLPAFCSSTREFDPKKMGQAFILYQRPDNSVVELARFNLVRFELDGAGASSLFGLELARLVVDTSYPELIAKQSEIERQTMKLLRRR